MSSPWPSTTPQPGPATPTGSAARSVTGSARGSLHEASGGMEITVLRDPLPTMIELGVHVPASAVGRQVPAERGAPRDEVLMGRAARGGDVVWRPDDNGRAHLFIAGRTGGGKGVASAAVLAHAVKAGWQVLVINPKQARRVPLARLVGVDREDPGRDVQRVGLGPPGDGTPGPTSSTTGLASPPGPKFPWPIWPGIGWPIGSWCSSMRSSD